MNNRGADWNNPSVYPLVPPTSCLTKPNPCWCWAFRPFLSLTVSLSFSFLFFFLHLLPSPKSAVWIAIGPGLSSYFSAYNILPWALWCEVEEGTEVEEKTERTKMGGEKYEKDEKKTFIFNKDIKRLEEAEVRQKKESMSSSRVRVKTDSSTGKNRLLPATGYVSRLSDSKHPCGHVGGVWGNCMLRKKKDCWAEWAYYSVEWSVL